MDASPTMEVRTENIAQLRCAVRNNPSSLHAPIDWDASPEDLVDWSTRVVEERLQRSSINESTSIPWTKNGSIYLDEQIYKDLLL